MSLEIEASKKYNVLLSADDEWFVEMDKTLSYLLIKLTGKGDMSEKEKVETFNHTAPLWDFKNKLALAHNNANN